MIEFEDVSWWLCILQLQVYSECMSIDKIEILIYMQFDLYA